MNPVTTLNAIATTISLAHKKPILTIAVLLLLLANGLAWNR